MNVTAIRDDFPILSRQIHGKPLIYLDSAATSQKPKQMVAAISDYYLLHNANVHRGVHQLGTEATELFETARDKVRAFINAPDMENIVFTRGTTESINMVARGFGKVVLQPGDVVISTAMEHHSNLIPWQEIAREKGAEMRYLPLGRDGEIDVEAALALIDERVKILAIAHVSNVMGTINPIEPLIKAVHAQGGYAVIDGAQSVPHMPTDVQALDVDFLAFSGHKMLGPMGIGVLYGKRHLLDQMNPVMFGGEMISHVDLACATWRELPWKFEGGTPNVEGAVGLAAAIDYLQHLGMTQVHQHEETLVAYALDKLAEMGTDLEIYGPRQRQVGLITFNLVKVHPHDVATVLDAEGVAIRAGHHCAQPLMHYLNVPATARASFYIYNDEKDVDQLVTALQKTKEYFQHAAR